MVHPPHKGRELRLTRAQVRRVDLICTERYGIPGIVLMENAARALFATAVKMLGTAGGRRVLIVCGGGNNGGDGYALARHLHNAGYDVLIAAAKPVSQLVGDAAINARICERMSLPIEPATPDLVESAPADLVVDALVGTGLDKAPSEDSAALMRAINQRREPVLAVDVPSGLDCDTGRPLGSPEDCVRAERTVTFVAEKVGFASAREYTGDVIVGDIGAPAEAVEEAVAQEVSIVGRR